MGAGASTRIIVKRQNGAKSSKAEVRYTNRNQRATVELVHFSEVLEITASRRDLGAERECLKTTYPARVESQVSG